ncbi:hypothetical protein [Chryseobacterium hispalense]|uniref:hypothetical protein n=1 Tax=Chryseobacterium hispalense TaxID=1453492 RepID=UPI00391B80CA
MRIIFFEMFFKSKYIIEFSKPKEEILNDIDKNLYKKFFDWNKRFAGEVSDNSFDVKFFQDKMSPYFKGRFVGKENKPESIELTVYSDAFSIFGSIFETIILLGFAIAFFLQENYLWIAAMIIIYILIVLSHRVRINNAKDNFFEYLKKLDTFSKIVPVKK